MTGLVLDEYEGVSESEIFYLPLSPAVSLDRYKYTRNDIPINTFVPVQ